MRNFNRWAIVLALIVTWLTVVPADCRAQWIDICLRFMRPITAKLSCILSGDLPLELRGLWN